MQRHTIIAVSHSATQLQYHVNTLSSRTSRLDFRRRLTTVAGSSWRLKSVVKTVATRDVHAPHRDGRQRWNPVIVVIELWKPYTGAPACLPWRPSACHGLERWWHRVGCTELRCVAAGDTQYKPPTNNIIEIWLLARFGSAASAPN